MKDYWYSFGFFQDDTLKTKEDRLKRADEIANEKIGSYGVPYEFRSWYDSQSYYTFRTVNGYFFTCDVKIKEDQVHKLPEETQKELTINRIKSLQELTGSDTCSECGHKFCIKEDK